MGAFYRHKLEARQKVHDEMCRPAVYFKPPYDPAALDTKIVTVRVHDKFMALGDLKGTNFNYAETEAVVPKAIFLVEEVVAVRGYIISMEEGLAYQIDHTQETDNLTQTSNVIKMEPAKTVGFPLPEDFI